MNSTLNIDLIHSALDVVSSIFAEKTMNFSPEQDSLESSFNVKWEFEPWDQPKAQEPDWRIWKPVVGTKIIYERDRFGRFVKPKVVCTQNIVNQIA